jgi:uncharacterized protein (TIGR02271 family)
MTIPQQENLIGLKAVDAEGDQIGKVGDVYLNDVSGQPEWVTVSTGMFGTRESFAPMYNSSVSGDQLTLAVSKQLVKDAPGIDSDGHLSEAEINALYEYYGEHLAGDDRSTDDAMTRSEERLHVGTESTQVGRARLRKYVVTENVTTSVPVSHEEVRLEREPITDANRDAALSGSDISEEEHEVTLHAERPVVAKETVPVERVRLGTETVTEEHQVEEQIRKEQIDEPEVDSRPEVG